MRTLLLGFKRVSLKAAPLNSRGVTLRARWSITPRFQISVQSGCLLPTAADASLLSAIQKGDIPHMHDFLIHSVTGTCHQQTSYNVVAHAATLLITADAPRAAHRQSLRHRWRFWSSSSLGVSAHASPQCRRRHPQDHHLASAPLQMRHNPHLLRSSSLVCTAADVTLSSSTHWLKGLPSASTLAVQSAHQ